MCEQRGVSSGQMTTSEAVCGCFVCGCGGGAGVRPCRVSGGFLFSRSLGWLGKG